MGCGLDARRGVCSDGEMKRSARVLWVIVLAGCRDAADGQEPGGSGGASGSGGSDEPSIVMVDFHPPDVAEPRETWADKVSGLQFTTPGSGWTRIEGEALPGLGADVKLAVRQGERCSGWVSGRAAGGVTARVAADSRRTGIGFEGFQVQVDEDVKYDLWTARRYEVQGKVDGRTTVERATWWLAYGNLYGVVARTSERDYGSRRRCLDAITAGFALGMPAP